MKPDLAESRICVQWAAQAEGKWGGKNNHEVMRPGAKQRERQRKCAIMRGELKERARQEGEEVREEEGGDEQERRRRERREQQDEKGREKGATIFIERQSLVAFSLGGSEAHLSVFSNRHSVPTYCLPPALCRHHHSRSSSHRLGYRVPAGQGENRLLLQPHHSLYSTLIVFIKQEMLRAHLCSYIWEDYSCRRHTPCILY